MLSKLRHIGAVENANVWVGEDLTSALQTKLGGGLGSLCALAGGTLGICFIGELAGQRRFFKTHSVLAGRQTLKNEVAFLNATAGDRADACLINVGLDDEARTWLHMKVLRPCKELTPLAARELVAAYETTIQSFPLADLVPKTDDIGLLLSEAKAALALLGEQRLLSLDVQRQIQGCLEHLRSNYGAWPVQLCHGDLGPSNILTDGCGPIAIDWEDAFWGVAGYDYLYWLTFFHNRKWLSPEALGHTPLGHVNEVALMVAILLLKSQLSVRDGSYQRNKISFDQRLLEVINLD